MRSDMVKVLTSGRTGRNGHETYAKENKKDQVSVDAPKAGKMKRRSGYTGYNFNPIRNMILKSIGKRWDDIYSDLAPLLKNFPDDALREWLEWYVRLGVRMIDGYPHRVGRGVRYRFPTQCGTDWHPLHRNELYVDGKGILRRAEGLPRTYAPRPIDRVIVNEYLECHRIDGIWYWMKYRPYREAHRRVFTDVFGKEHVTIFDYDGITKQYLTARDATKKYGRRTIGESKKQMNKRAIKKYIPEDVRW